MGDHACVEGKPSMQKADRRFLSICYYDPDVFFMIIDVPITDRNERDR